MCCATEPVFEFKVMEIARGEGLHPAASQAKQRALARAAFERTHACPNIHQILHFEAMASMMR